MQGRQKIAEGGLLVRVCSGLPADRQEIQVAFINVLVHTLGVLCPITRKGIGVHNHIFDMELKFKVPLIRVRGKYYAAGVMPFRV